MSSARHDFVTALQRVTQAIERLTAEELAKLVDESYEIEIRLIRKRHKEEVEVPSNADLELVLSKLAAFCSRDEALNYLANTFETRKPLEQVARWLDIAVVKQDRIEILREKIVEATTGARIRSQAIKGGV
jgi:hypothetical protein